MESEQEELEETRFSEESLEEQEIEQEAQELVEKEHTSAEREIERREEQRISKPKMENQDRSGFIHGLSVGLGMGCITTFIIMWIAVFFSPQLPQTITYESMLSIFIYPLLYLLAIGLVALTAGVVREYYAKK
jgi:hypothetical protein